MLGGLLSSSGIAVARHEVVASAKRLRLRAILLGIAVGLWLLAFAFALATLAVWLSTVIGPIGACAVLAAVFAVAALVLHIAIAIIRRRHPSLVASISRALSPIREAADRQRAEHAEANPSSPSPVAEAGSVGTLLMLGVIGYVMGRRLTAENWPPPQ